MKLNFSKKEIVLLGMWSIIVLVMLFLGRSMFLTIKQDDYNDGTAHLYDVDIAEVKISQEVQLDDSVEKISFLVKNNSGVEQTVSYTMYDAVTLDVLAEMQAILTPKEDTEQLVEWKIGKSIQLPESVIIEISETHVADGVFICVQSNSFGCKYVENETVVDAHIRMAVVYDMSYNYVLFGICTIFLISIGLLLIFKSVKNIEIEKVFVFVAFFAGVIFAFVTPFGQEPDGWYHFTRSMDVSMGNIFLPFFDNNGSSAIMLLPDNINSIGFRKINPNGMEGTLYMDNVKSLYFSENIVPMEGMGGFCSLFYLPQAVGLCVARILGLSAYGYMFCGRITNLLAYVCLTYIGLKKMPVFRNIFLVIALLPMTIFQAASFSYDAVLCGLCFLFIGLCFNYAYEKECLSWRNVLILGCILALLLLCKYVYVCIGLLVFIIPIRKFGQLKDYGIAFVIALLPIIMMIGFLLLNSGVFATPVSSQTVSEPAQISQLSFILQNPVFGIKVFVRTCLLYFCFYVEQLNTLGWLNYTLGVLEFLMPIFMVVVAMLDTKEYKEEILPLHRCLYFITFAVVVAAGMLGLYLMDGIANPVGAPTIQGYQGRYTIPVLMLLLAAMTSKSIENKMKNFSHNVVAFMGIALVYSAIMVLYKCY